MKLDIKRFMEELAVAKEYELPEMGEGTRYLYEHLYKPMANNQEARISGLDFDAFMLEEIETFQGLYVNVLDMQTNQIDAISKAIGKIPPKASKTRFL